MDTIIIYEADGTPWKTVKISANCYYRDALEGDESVELRWEAYDYAKIPVGSYVNIEGRVYRLTEPHEPTRRTESIYTFAPVFYSQTYHWKKAMACLYEYGSAVTYTDTDNTISATIPEPTSRELDWSFTGNLPDALFMLIQMIKNETGVVWNAHYAAEVADTLIEYVSQGSSIFDFMSKIAEQCKKEFHFDYSGATPVVNIGTLEIEAQGTHTSEGRVLLNVGEDVTNPSVQSEAEEYFTRFYFFGSTRNIVQPNSVTKSSVVNRRLPLCPSKVTTSGYNDMNYYPKGFIDIDRKPSSYSDREYIPDLPPYKVFSKSIFFDDIYPRSDLKIQSVQTRHIAVIDDAGAETGENMPIYYVKLVNESGAAFNFNSGTYPNGDMLPTLVPSIAFRSGYLQGLEYELIYHATDFTVNTTGSEGQGGRVTIQAPCFEIVFDTNSNPRLPNDNIKPQVNDKCTLFNIHMPQEYIWNAQKELEQKAIEYIDDLNVDKSTYELNSNPLAFESFVALGNLQVGSLVKMVYPNGETIKSRVIGIERHLDIPCDCKITLGYSARQGTIQTLRQVIEDTSANVESVVKEGDKTKAQLLGLKNGYLAQKEVFDSTFDADGYFDGSRIKPLTVETNALSVGSRSQQFTLSGVQLSVAKYTTGNGTLSWTCTNGKLAHLSLDEDYILVWPMATGTQALNDANSHYIYAKVAKDGFGAASGGIKTNSNSGTFVATAEQKKFDSDQDYYYFLVGTISSVQTDSGSSYKTRIISLTYGTTTINGKQIQTGVIRSSDGSSVIINLDEGTITGNIQFLSGGQAVDAEQFINNTVDDAVSEIEIGGRNYIRINNAWEQGSCGVVAGKTWEQCKTTSTRRIRTKTTIAIEKNTKYTISIKGGYKYELDKFSNGLATGYVGWKTDTYTFDSGNNDSVAFLVSFAVDADITPAEIENVKFKLEQGTVATDWTPAPEDVDAGISTAQTAAANAQQAANNAQTTINNMDSDSYFSTVEKKSFRSEWKAICGVDNTTTTPTASSTYGGSYEQALKAAQGTTVSTTALTTAFGNLRGHLNTYKLYTNPPEDTNWGTSGQTTLATYVKAYYNAEQAFYDALADYWSEVKAQQAVNNLQIGGKNLLLNSSFAETLNNWGGSGASINTATGFNCAQVEGALASTKNAQQLFDSRINTAEKNIFTFSGEIAITPNAAQGTTNCFVTPYYDGSKNGSWYGGTLKKFTLNGVEYNSATIGKAVFDIKGLGFKKFEYTFEVAAGVTSNRVYMYCRDYTGTFYFRNLKLEKGNKATDWSPAPEDRNYDDVVANLTAACASAEGATDKVVICPDLTAKMLTDSKMRMKIKFINANTATTFRLIFRNTAGGDIITPVDSGATTTNVRLYYGGRTSSNAVYSYWLAEQEVELKYDSVRSEYQGGTAVHLTMTDEAAFTTTMAFSKAMKGKTEVKGGLILTNVVQAGEGSTQAGMSGLSETDVAFWAGDSIGNAQLLLAPVVIMRDGRAKFGILRFDENGNISMPINEKSRLNILSGGLPPTNISAWTGNTWGNTGGTTSTETNSTTLTPLDYGSTERGSHNGMVVSVTGGGYVGLKSTSGTQTIGELAIVVQAGMNKVVAFKVTGITLTTTVQYFSLSGVNTEVSYGYASTSYSISLIATYSGLTAPVAITFASNTSGGTSGNYGIHAQWNSDTTTPITNIANNGLLVLLKNTDYFEVKESGGKLYTTIKGKTNISGVLWAGTITSGSNSGSASTKFANNGVSVSVTRNNTGDYTISLSGAGGNTTDEVSAFANVIKSNTTGNGWSANIIGTPTKGSIRVKTYSDNTITDTSFTLCVIGYNY